VVGGYSDGTVTLSAYHEEDDEKLKIGMEWRDSRFKKDSSCIGLASKNKWV
jgi:hypothetical protein